MRPADLEDRPEQLIPVRYIVNGSHQRRPSVRTWIGKWCVSHYCWNQRICMWMGGEKWLVRYFRRPWVTPGLSYYSSRLCGTCRTECNRLCFAGNPHLGRCRVACQEIPSCRSSWLPWLISNSNEKMLIMLFSTSLSLKKFISPILLFILSTYYGGSKVSPMCPPFGTTRRCKGKV